MKNISEQYELLLESATKVASACLDMENGALLLAWSGELIRDLAAAGYVRSAALAVRKLCETVDTEAQWIGDGEMRKEEKQAWFQLFVEALIDCVKATNTIRSSS